jgi:hypothetical protein
LRILKKQHKPGTKFRSDRNSKRIKPFPSDDYEDYGNSTVSDDFVMDYGKFELSARFFGRFSSGANPKIVSYNASAVKINNATKSLVRIENKNIFF